MSQRSEVRDARAFSDGNSAEPKVRNTASLSTTALLPDCAMTPVFRTFRSAYESRIGEPSSVEEISICPEDRETDAVEEARVPIKAKSAPSGLFEEYHMTVHCSFRISS